MISQAAIRRYVQQLAREFSPERVILFGSYATGKATEDSDVDLLVIMQHEKPRNVEQAVEIGIRLHARFPLDLLVRRPTELRRRLEEGDSFLRDAVTDGKVLYQTERQSVA